MPHHFHGSNDTLWLFLGIAILIILYIRSKQNKSHSNGDSDVIVKDSQTKKQSIGKDVKGTAIAKYKLYESRSDNLNFKDGDYLDFLLQAVHEKEIRTLIGLDKIYRRIGEYYEQHGDMKNAIENWETAMQMNPDVGVKRKLEAAKKRL